jgi:hypothetical protein
MRFFIAVAAIAMFASALFVGAGSASAHGTSPAKLTAAGWNCFDVPGLGVHCQPPGDGASGATLTFLVFDTSDPSATHAPFTGTELLISTGLYHGQPCPQEGLDEYVDLSGGGLPYFACHHR